MNINMSQYSEGCLQVIAQHHSVRKLPPLDCCCVALKIVGKIALQPRTNCDCLTVVDNLILFYFVTSRPGNPRHRFGQHSRGLTHLESSPCSLLKPRSASNSSLTCFDSDSSILGERKGCKTKSLDPDCLTLSVVGREA